MDATERQELERCAQKISHLLFAVIAIFGGRDGA